MVHFDITLLPEEVLQAIFAFVHRLEDVRRVGLVCRLWHKVVWSSRTVLPLRKFPQILEGNQFQYLLRCAPYVTQLSMPGDTTDNHICKIGYLLPHLKNLALRRCRNVSNVGMEWISTLQLEELYLSTSWNISTLDFLVGSNATLETLELRGCDLLTDDALLSLKELAKEPFYCLKNLDIRDCNGFTDKGFSLLGELFPNIKLLDVSGCSVTLQTIEKFSELKKLRKLYLWGCQQITDSSMEIISKFPRLTGLSTIECDALSDLGYKILARSKTLTWLEVGSKGVTDHGIDSLLNMISLEELNVISNTINITKEHLEGSIESKRPDIKWRFAQLAL